MGTATSSSNPVGSAETTSAPEAVNPLPEAPSTPRQSKRDSGHLGESPDQTEVKRAVLESLNEGRRLDGLPPVAQLPEFPMAVDAPMPDDDGFHVAGSDDEVV